MTKSELKPGLVVQFHNEEYAITLTIGNQIILVGEDSYVSMDELYEDMTHGFSKDHTIDKVFEVHSEAYLQDILNGNYLTLLWERPVKIEMTISEIEKIAGLKPGSLIIKN